MISSLRWLLLVVVFVFGCREAGPPSLEVSCKPEVLNPDKPYTTAYIQCTATNTGQEGRTCVFVRVYHEKTNHQIRSRPVCMYSKPGMSGQFTATFDDLTVGRCIGEDGSWNCELTPYTEDNWPQDAQCTWDK